MSAALARPAPAAATPPAFAPFPVPRMLPGHRPPSQRRLGERAVACAAARLGQEQHCLAVAHERLADAERPHSEGWADPRGRVCVAATPRTPERMAELRASALARVAECEARVAAADLALAEARWLLARVLDAGASS